MAAERMKNNKPNNKSAGERRTKPVHIEFTHATATKISIAGTFNDWHPGATPMVPIGEGRWVKELVLPPGVYEYRMVVDGKWLPDPRATETAPNPFGEINSVLKVNGNTG
jgi:1,4-alpha-glucan branching enzyme